MPPDSRRYARSGLRLESAGAGGRPGGSESGDTLPQERAGQVPTGGRHHLGLRPLWRRASGPGAQSGPQAGPPRRADSATSPRPCAHQAAKVTEVRHSLYCFYYNQVISIFQLSIKKKKIYNFSG